MSLKHGEYDAKASRKESRKSGNFEHRSAMSGMGTSWAGGLPDHPMTICAIARMGVAAA